MCHCCFSAPTRGDKPPALGTPLNYKQSFVLLTSSQFEDYSLNNKMNGNDTIGLQCRDVKGEMYLAIEKEGYTLEAVSPIRLSLVIEIGGYAGPWLLNQFQCYPQ